MGLLRSLLEHPEEIPALVKLMFAASAVKKQVPTDDPNLSFCYIMLQRVSRTFAFVIQQLGKDLRDVVCVYYLVLRVLDTVEDDMSIPVETKLPLLKSLHEKIHDPTWHFLCGDEDHIILMKGFHHVSTAFLRLEKRYRNIIEDIANKMGHGMAKFLSKEVETVGEYDEYCHYVAGLVGLGLSRFFHTSGLEDWASDELSNSMGLFLQKAHVIRDYLENVNELPANGRMIWPREIWGKYASKLQDFKEETNSKAAVECLNELITNALDHAPDCLKYMSALKVLPVFRLCAIPQIVAIGTLAVCYNNINVFRGVVKLRRGLAAKIIDQTRTMGDVYGAFYSFSCMLALKIDKSDPSAQQTLSNVEAIVLACQTSGKLSKRWAFSNKTNKLGTAAILSVLLILCTMTILYMMSKNV